jgi:putative inorganic carbon (hco3(-)) transporter
MRKTRVKQDVESPEEQGSRDAAFYLFCVFIVSYFTHLAARIPALGVLHVDLLLAGAIALAIAFSGPRRRKGPAPPMDPVAKQLWLLLGYIIVTIPFVEWPGSVIHNLQDYAKSLCFFFFVVATVDTTRKLRILLGVYVAAQVFRVLEPLEMHIRGGYWGSFTSLGNWEYMDRLAGSPFDVINPNGLGFVIIMTLPLLHLILKPDTTARKVLLVALVGAMCYALVLSASRSGFLGLIFLGVLLVWGSKHRGAYLTLGAVLLVASIALMTDLQRERYVSIFSHSAKGGATAEARITGVIDDFKVSLRRPFFGHGLGTSAEANSHFRGEDLPSHNLYTEVAEELGYVGLVLLLGLIWGFLKACWRAQLIVSATPMTDPRLRFLHEVAVALVVVVGVDLFFSFAAFGFSEPYWYFFGGLSVATARLAVKLVPAVAEIPALQRRGRRKLTRGPRAAVPSRTLLPRPVPRARTR